MTDFEDEIKKTEDKKETKKEDKVKVKVIDEHTCISHGGKIYKKGDVIEMTKSEMERLAKMCNIEEVRK